VKRHTSPASAGVVASALGDPVATQVTAMLRSSDNDYAEALHRLVAVHTGHPGTWEGAAAAARAALLRLGVDLGASVVHDGSGLSRADRLSPAVVVALLATIFDDARPELASLRHDSLPIAGVSGTLGPSYLRYVTRPTRCAAGLVEAKTGSLRGVITLSGFAVGADGRVKLFSFLLNRVPSTLQTRRAVDRLATTVTGCW
jgi:D-alanyl-D-alanine carboxypeptidase/D-alanyl-D-alanine-endopeptidase (penicillin-binding protein 4)